MEKPTDHGKEVIPHHPVPHEDRPDGGRPGRPLLAGERSHAAQDSGTQSEIGDEDGGHEETTATMTVTTRANLRL
jgi:hypothetical protein